MASDKHLRCSFCGKSKDSVRKFISGPSVYICNECIALCNEILAEDEEREVAEAITQVPTPAEIKEVLYLRQTLNELFAKHTGQAFDKIESDIDRDRYMSADEAVKYGIIDKVIQQKYEVDGGKPAA